MSMKDGLMSIGALLLLAGLVQGCSYTKTVESRKKITAASQAPGDRVKFVYKETSPDKENKQGLIECSVNDDGTLNNCDVLRISFQDQQGESETPQQ